VTLAACARLKLCIHRTSVFCSTARGLIAFVSLAPCDSAEESHVCQSVSQTVAGWSTGSCSVVDHRDVPPLQMCKCSAAWCCCLAFAECMLDGKTSPSALKPQCDSCCLLHAGHDERPRS